MNSRTKELIENMLKKFDLDLESILYFDYDHDFEKLNDDIAQICYPCIGIPIDDQNRTHSAISRFFFKANHMLIKNKENDNFNLSKLFFKYSEVKTEMMKKIMLFGIFNGQSVFMCYQTHPKISTYIEILESICPYELYIATLIHNRYLPPELLHMVLKFL